jgi:inhibitor of cysteine peptidase
MNVHALTAADHGRVLDLTVGDEIVLELPESPSTGYRWRAEYDPALTLVASDWAPAFANTVGGSGIRRLRFRAAARGDGQLKVKHWREWIGESSVTDQHSFMIAVR